MKALLIPLLLLSALIWPAVAEEMTTIRFVYNRNSVRILRTADSALADSGFRIQPGAVLEMKVPKSWLPIGAKPENLDLASIIRKMPTRTPRGGSVDHYYSVRVISSNGPAVPSDQEFSLAMASMGWGERSGNLNSKGGYIVQSIGRPAPPMPQMRPADLGQVAVTPPTKVVPMPLPRPADLGQTVAAPSKVVPMPLPRPANLGSATVVDDSRARPEVFASDIVDPGWMTQMQTSAIIDRVHEPVGVVNAPATTETVSSIVTASLEMNLSEDTELPVMELNENFDVVSPSAEKQDRQCVEALRNQEPFSISHQTGLGTANWENFRSLDASKSVQSYIPLNSIVKLVPQAEQHMEDVRSSDYVPVEVLSTPTSKLAEEAPTRASRAELRADILKSNKPRAKKGDRGYIHRGSLRPANNYTFVVAKNAPLINVPGMSGSLNGRPLRLAQVGEKYKVIECCYVDELTGQKVCEDNPVFAVLGDNLTDILAEVALEDDFMCNVRAVANNQLGALKEIAEMAFSDMGQGIEDLQYIDSRGLVKIPLDRGTCTESGMTSVFGSFNYNPDEGCNKINDQFAPPETACALMRVLQDHQRAHADKIDPLTGQLGGGYEVQFGDMYHPRGWGDHASHGSGHCIDIRPLRKQAGRGSVSIGSGQVDMGKTCELIKRFRDAGADTVYFGKTCGLLGPSVTTARDHDDHFHVCLPPNSPRVQATCRNGL